MPFDISFCATPNGSLNLAGFYTEENVGIRGAFFHRINSENFMGLSQSYLSLNEAVKNVNTTVFRYENGRPVIFPGGLIPGFFQLLTVR